MVQTCRATNDWATKKKARSSLDICVVGESHRKKVKKKKNYNTKQKILNFLMSMSRII